VAPTRRAAEQEHFGAATPAEAQAAEPRRDDEMIEAGGTASRSPEETVRAFFEAVFNEGRLDAIEDFVTLDHANHDPTAPPVPAGPQGVRQLVENYREAFPDLAFSIEDIFACGDRVAHRWTFTGTHEGEMLGVAPTGRRVEVTGIELNRIVDGKIADSWAISDAAGLKEQLETAASGG
jgi:steroid delta-isomerase-like uncharacterized protein